MIESGHFHFRRNSSGDVLTDVPHLISWKSPSDFSRAPGFNWGYMGTGPHELSANILWIMDVLHEMDCIYWAPKFSFEVLGQLPQDGGQISKAEIRAWIESKEIETRTHHPGRLH